MTRSGGALSGFVAVSDAMRRVRDLAVAAAAGGGGVLLCGEPGSGRRYLARFIHQLRAEDPEAVLVEFDAAAPDAEARLFATRSGTPERNGSRDRATRTSPLCQAVGGSLLLLNVPALAPRVQERLLRVLSAGEVAVVGNGTLRGEIRLMASVLPSFRDAVAGKARMNPELVRRLSTWSIEVPCLHERRADIPGLAEVFLRELAERTKTPAVRLSAPAVTLLSSLPYPGHVRELRDIVESAARTCDGHPIGLEALLPAVRFDRLGGADKGRSLRDARARFERQYILDVLERHRGRVGDAARALGIHRPNLYRKMRLLGITHAPKGS